MIIQDLFKNCDVKIVGDYMLNLMSEKTRNKHIKNINTYYNTIKNTISDILSLEPILNNDYIYVSMAYDIEEAPWLAASIVKTDEIIKNSELVNSLSSNFLLDKYKEEGLKIVPYSLMFIPREELIGYKFAEYSFSVFDRNEIIASILFELTYFGYSNKDNKENINKESKELNESIDEIDKNNLVNFDDAMKEIYGEKWNEKTNKYIPPTQEQIDKNILDNMIPIYKEYKWILDRELI